MGLQTYRRKRNFTRISEPRGGVAKQSRQRFVVHEHHASRLHYDFRLEAGGVLKSWAIPKGPSLNPRQKRLAVMVEDHPVEYLHFAGHIAEGNYGAGEVTIWDTGRYELVTPGDLIQQIERGKCSIILHGKKLRGEFQLVRMAGKNNQWLLIKSNDDFASPEKSDTTGNDPKPKVRHAIRAAEPQLPRRQVQSRAHNVRSLTQALRAKELPGEVTATIGAASLSLTHLDKLYWPDEGYTKGDLLRYYCEVAPSLLAHLKGRPLILLRYPNGITAPSFYQHDVDQVPVFVRTFPARAESGKVVDYVVCDNLATLLYIVNLGTIAQNPWHSRTDHPDTPDWVVFDLDPYEVEFAAVQELALGLKDLLDHLGLASYPKTSGASGMHVYVPLKPLYTYEQVAHFAELVALVTAREHPQVATLERSLKKRPAGRIYLDHLQNARGKSVVAPYSVRAQAGAPVSTPLAWHEVQRPLQPGDFTIRNVPQRLVQHGDCFAPVLAHKQHLDEALKTLEKLLSVHPDKAPQLRKSKKRGKRG